MMRIVTCQSIYGWPSKLWNIYTTPQLFRYGPARNIVPLTLKATLIWIPNEAIICLTLIPFRNLRKSTRIEHTSDKTTNDQEMARIVWFSNYSNDVTTISQSVTTSISFKRTQAYKISRFTLSARGLGKNKFVSEQYFTYNLHESGSAPCQAPDKWINNTHVEWKPIVSIRDAKLHVH